MDPSQDQSNPPLNTQGMEPTGPPSAPRSPQFGAPNKKPKKWLVWAGIALAVIALAVAAYFLFMKGSSPAPYAPPSGESSSRQPNNPSTLNEPQANATEKTFKSDKLNIELTYRSDWELKESADKTLVTVTSPRVTYTKDGESTNGVFTVKLRHGVIPDSTQQAVQKLIAVRDSLVIAYAHPNGDQRQYTNLSYGGPDAQSFRMFIVTGNTALKKGQTFGAQVDLMGNAYMFVGGYGTDSNDTLDFDDVPADSFDSTDAYEQAQKIIESIRIF